MELILIALILYQHVVISAVHAVLGVLVWSDTGLSFLVTAYDLKVP